jgi:hypothetical protein
MTLPILHVVFNPSAAAALRPALEKAGRDDQVVALFDDLNFGPINPPDPRIRAAWVDAHLGYSGWEEMDEKNNNFWAWAVSSEGRRVVWVSKRSSQEYAGFLEFVWRVGDGSCEIVDLTDVMISRRSGPSSLVSLSRAITLAILPPDQILENRLVERAEDLTPGMRSEYRALWRSLRADDSALRVADGRGGLTSAPISFFDDQLQRSATGEWRSAARIVGDILERFWSDAVVQTGDLVLVSRLRALVEAGVLESRGDLSNVQVAEIRRASLP